MISKINIYVNKIYIKFIIRLIVSDLKENFRIQYFLISVLS